MTLEATSPVARGIRICAVSDLEVGRGGAALHHGTQVARLLLADG